MHRPIRKVDSNQAQIVEALRHVGAFVSDTHALGGGFPDLVVVIRGEVFPVEVKASKKDKLTPDEERWWILSGIDPIIAYDTKSALLAIGMEVV